MILAEEFEKINSMAFDTTTPTFGLLAFCSQEGQFLCVYRGNTENLDPERGAVKKVGGCISVLPTTASTMYSLYT